MHKIVICNGAYRSGSTFVFNVARRIIEHNGYQPEATGMSREEVQSLLRRDTGKWWVVKCHNYVPAESLPHVRTLRTFRDTLGVLGSWMQLNNRQTITPAQLGTFCGRMRLEHALTAKHKDKPDVLLIGYDDVYFRPAKVVSDIAHLLGLGSVGCTEQIVQELEVGRVRKMCAHLTALDPRTQWRSDQVSESEGDPEAWRLLVPPAVVATIKARFDDQE